MLKKKKVVNKVSKDNKAKHIIIAEDDSVYASVFKNKLTSEGYQVTLVEDGAKLLELLQTIKPDLLILDLIMPTVDGFGVLKEINANSRLKNLNILVASNLGQEEDMNRCLKMGAKGYFVKSDISISEMVAKVKNVIAGKKN